MADTIPFYSAKNPDVFHICSNCSEGKKIDPADRRPGTGGLQKCGECRRLSAKGAC
jgi:hypothetical protein